MLDAATYPVRENDALYANYSRCQQKHRSNHIWKSRGIMIYDTEVSIGFDSNVRWPTILQFSKNEDQVQ